MMKSGLEKMKEVFGTDPKDVLMGLGIGMQQKYYEVGLDFYENFVNKFGKESELIQKSFKWNENTGKYHFDNTKFNLLKIIMLVGKQFMIILKEEWLFCMTMKVN